MPERARFVHPAVRAIDEERRRMGVTQRQLADRAGYDRVHYSKMVKGRYAPALQTVSDFAEALGLILLVVPGESRPSADVRETDSTAKGEHP